MKPAYIRWHGKRNGQERREPGRPKKGTDVKVKFQRAIRRSDWYGAARILIENCDFHGFETDEIDTWLSNGDVAYVLSREPQELADAYADWIRLARYTIEAE